MENVQIEVDLTTTAYSGNYFAGYGSNNFAQIINSSIVGFLNGNPYSYNIE
jgi:hypothetical protein